MFRRRREKKAMKEAAKKAKKAEVEAAAAASGIQLLRVAPKGTQYGGEGPEYPDYPLGNAMMMSRSMDGINDLPPPPTKGKKKKKKTTLRRAQSLAEDGLAPSPQERYRPQERMYEIREAPVYYEQSQRPGSGQPREGPVFYYDRNPVLAPTNGHAHPSMGPRYFVASHPRQLSMDAVYPTPNSPLSHQPHPQFYNTYQPRHTPAGTPTSTGRTPSPARAARYRNVHIIPKAEHSPTRQKRPALNIQSTPLRTPSPARSPSPAIFNTVPRNKNKGKVIKVVEGWDEPKEETPKVVQSHEVGVAPTSRVMEEFKVRNTASPYAITISNDDSTHRPLSSAIASSRSPAARAQLREGSDKRRNKARPVSAAPWSMISGEEEYHQRKLSVERRNGHMVMAFDQ